MRDKLLILLLFIGHTSVTDKTDFKINCPNPSVEAKPNETVILQCVSEPRMEIQKVEWMLNDTHEVHLYRDGEDDYTEQWGAFKDRTSLFHSELPSGNCSLRLTAQMSHSGKYRCATRIQDVTKECFLNLTVSNASQLSDRMDGPSQPTTHSKPGDATSNDVSVPITVTVCVFVFVLLSVIGGLIWKYKRSKPGSNESGRNGAGAAHTAADTENTDNEPWGGSEEGMSLRPLNGEQQHATQTSTSPVY